MPTSPILLTFQTSLILACLHPPDVFCVYVWITWNEIYINLWIHLLFWQQCQKKIYWNWFPAETISMLMRLYYSGTWLTQPLEVLMQMFNWTSLAVFCLGWSHLLWCILTQLSSGMTADFILPGWRPSWILKFPLLMLWLLVATS